MIREDQPLADRDNAPNDRNTSALEAALNEVWSDGKGFWAWLTTSDQPRSEDFCFSSVFQIVVCDLVK